jgi:hypothetical protein
MPRSWLRGRSNGIATSALIVPGRAVMLLLHSTADEPNGLAARARRRRGLVWHTVC